jgi:hypothetical protein
VRRSPLLLVLALLALAAPAHADAREVPQGFLGTMVDGPLLADGAPLDREFGVMVRTGVERVRTVLYWDQIQPQPGPLDLAATDRLVGAAAARRLSILAVLARAPVWARKHPQRLWSPPADPAAFAAFAAAMAARYGPGGTFWAAHPELPQVPIRQWQIWNEPAGFDRGRPSAFWDDPGTPYPQPYVALLRAAHDAIRAVDPRATIVLAGLFGRSWRTLPPLLAAGAAGLFDQVAAHVFTGRPRDPARVVALLRRAMRRARVPVVPVVLTEISWTASRGRLDASEGPPQGYEVSRADQARRLTTALEDLARKRRSLRIAGVFWNTWLSRHSSRTDRFDYAGLRRAAGDRIIALPAQRAFARIAERLEGCRKRTSAVC